MLSNRFNIFGTKISLTFLQKKSKLCKIKFSKNLVSVPPSFCLCVVRAVQYASTQISLWLISFSFEGVLTFQDRFLHFLFLKIAIHERWFAFSFSLLQKRFLRVRFGEEAMSGSRYAQDLPGSCRDRKAKSFEIYRGESFEYIRQGMQHTYKGAFKYYSSMFYQILEPSPLCQQYQRRLRPQPPTFFQTQKNTFEMTKNRYQRKKQKNSYYFEPP